MLPTNIKKLLFFLFIGFLLTIVSIFNLLTFIYYKNQSKILGIKTEKNDQESYKESVIWEKLLEKYPNHIPAIIEFGKALCKEGNTKLCKEILEGIKKEKPYFQYQD